MFCLGISDTCTGPAPKELSELRIARATLKVDTTMAKGLLNYGIESGIDFSYSQEMILDHAFMVPLSLLTPRMDLPIVPLHTIIARSQGFNELMFFGDHIDFVSAGVVATEKNISQRPDFVRRFIRGALKTFYWIKSNEKEVVARLAKATKSSEADGLELYRTGLKLFSQDGTIPRTLQERMISLQRKVLQLEKEVPPESIYDFSFVRTGNKELGKGESP